MNQKGIHWPSLGWALVFGGCVLMSALIAISAVPATVNEVLPITPIPTTVLTTVATIQPTSLPTTIPTPASTIDPEIAFRASGGYNMQEWYNISKLGVHTTVYRYQFRDVYHRFENPSGGYTLTIPDPGMKFLFVFVDMWMDPDASPINTIDYTHFTLQYQGSIINPMVSYPYFLQETSTYKSYFKNSYAVPFGCQWANNYELKERVLEPIGRFVGGKSNALDGYIIFQVPKEAQPANLKVLFNVGSLGNAWFRFTGGDIFSVN